MSSLAGSASETKQHSKADSDVKHRLFPLCPSNSRLLDVAVPELMLHALLDAALD
jgi:hypothetical protein